jgi:aldose 1-epimerase
MKSVELEIPGLISCRVLEYGGIIQVLKVPDKNQNMLDVVLGFDDFEDYQKAHPYFGALVGRYANRIAGASFAIGERTYQLEKNEGDHSLHGGKKGLDRVNWKIEEASSTKVILSHTSCDGEGGYPGELLVKVTYEVSENAELILTYRAQTSRPTYVNLTNHSYFNLNGGRESVLDHEITLAADYFTVIDHELIPTGEVRRVNGAMDLREKSALEAKISENPQGFDHNFVLNKNSGPQVILECPQTGIRMEMQTTEPGVQFYTGNFLDGSLRGKNGIFYQKHFGLCLEAQHFPDSPHHENFPSTLLLPGEVYHQKTIYKFSCSQTTEDGKKP